MSLRLTDDFQLWGLVERESFIYQRLDWLTKFKLTQMISRPRPEVSGELKRIALACDWPELLREMPSGDDAALVETSLMLPVQGILFFEIGPKAGEENWGRLLEVLKSLKVRSAQFFVPKVYNLSAKTVQKFADAGVRLESFQDEDLRSPWTWQ